MSAPVYLLARALHTFYAFGSAPCVGDADAGASSFLRQIFMWSRFGAVGVAKVLRSTSSTDLDFYSVFGVTFLTGSLPPASFVFERSFRARFCALSVPRRSAFSCCLYLVSLRVTFL